MTENIIKKGNFVQVHYIGTFEDGSVFDTSDGKDPLDLLAGQGMLIKGFDDALIDMKEGDEKEIDLTPEEGYGERKADLLKKVPISELGDDVKPEVGMMLGIKAPTGHVFPATITKVEEKEIELDANHPLAGKKLHFKMKIVLTREPTEEDLKKFQPKSCSTEGCGDCSSC